MAFSSTIAGRSRIGNKRLHWGTWDCTGVTGGDIDTGLIICESIILQPVKSAVVANQETVNETVPIDGSAITIVTNSGDIGLWQAIGY
jgi:hypothetical protein